jgi:hypothetical protein
VTSEREFRPDHERAGGRRGGGDLDSGASWVDGFAMPAAARGAVVEWWCRRRTRATSRWAGAYTVKPAGWIVDSEILTDWSRWGEVEGMPGALRMMDAAVLNGQIYVGGGINAAIVTNFCAFDGTNWQNAASFPAVRRNVAFAVLNGTLYSIGGQSAVGAYANVYAFNGTSWSSSVSLPAARTRLSAGVLERENLCGGRQQQHDGRDGNADQRVCLRRDDWTRWPDCRWRWRGWRWRR